MFLFVYFLYLLPFPKNLFGPDCRIRTYLDVKTSFLFLMNNRIFTDQVNFFIIHNVLRIRQSRNNFVWCRWRDSNSRAFAYKATALARLSYTGLKTTLYQYISVCQALNSLFLSQADATISSQSIK